MFEKVPSVKKNIYLLIVPVLSMLSFSLLYTFRHMDDNRLTSWKWTFSNTDMVWFVPVLALGLTLACALSFIKYERYNPALTLFLAAFASSTVFWSEPEVIVDVSRYFTYAKHLSLYGAGNFLSEWGNGIRPWTDLPFIPFVYGMIFKLFGEARIFIQIFNSALFSLTVVITYLTGKELWNDETGYYAGAMIMGIPYLFSQVPLMLVDIPTMFLLTLSIYTFIRVMEKGGAWILISSFVVFLAIISKYSTWMMLSVLVVIFMVYLLQSSKLKTQNCLNRGVYVAIITLTLTGVAFLLKSGVVLNQIDFLREYQAPGLRRWGESFVSTFLFQTHPFITISAIFSVYVAIKKRDIKFLIISWLIVLIVILQIRRSRYVMVIFPMFTLMASYGLSYLKNPDLKRYIVSSVVAFSLVVAIFAYLPFLKTMSEENILRAGKFMDAVDAPIVRVYTVPAKESSVNPAVSVPILDLYTRKQLLYEYDDKVIPPLEKIKESPLRFTWEYKNPEYYSTPDNFNDNKKIIAVISNGNDELPDYIKEQTKGLEKKKVFNTSTGIFRYAPVVTIYQVAQ